MSARYTILGTIASGGMARVYLGRMTGSAGFSRPVAIKRLHPELAVQRDFVAMLVDEARLAAHIRHTNVVDTLDLVVSDGAFSLVLEYVEGESLSALIREARARGETVPSPIALAVLYGVLRGLEAAHEARNEEGQPLGIVHRDVSPQNILVGIDGIPRIIDFGVAKALGRILVTRPGEVRGKFSYMAPEQLLG
ncbi:MAG: serine/threonine protein kinase, partial [Labilithrix sp.]|nr:serine/threonine protein kinase [Labilithrix sp.]